MREQEKFYHEANQFIDRNHNELRVVEGVAKYEFYKSIWTSRLGMVILGTVLAGMVYFVHDFTDSGAMRIPGMPQMFLGGLALAFALAVFTIIWKILSGIVRFFRREWAEFCGKYYEEPLKAAGPSLVTIVIYLFTFACFVRGVIYVIYKA